MGTERFKGCLLSALVIASLTVLALSISFTGSTSALPDGLTPHDPIYIDGNDNFTPANGVTSGSGTENDPYIIENWDITIENADGIQIKNTTASFIVRNSHIINIHGIKSGRSGISLVTVTNGVIENCIVENSAASGIRLANSDGNTIRNCTAKNNFVGINIYRTSNNNHIANSIVKNNRWIGINFLWASDNNIIENCIIQSNDVGIYLQSQVETNNNNYLYHNDFVNNEDQASDEGLNFWDDGYPSGGNYWSDYTGVDANNDGIGDTPYSVSGDDNQDRYPLMNPFAAILPEEPPTRWPLIVGIVAAVVIIIIVALEKA